MIASFAPVSTIDAGARGSDAEKRPTRFAALPLARRDGVKNESVSPLASRRRRVELDRAQQRVGRDVPHLGRVLAAHREPPPHLRHAARDEDARHGRNFVGDGFAALVAADLPGRHISPTGRDKGGRREVQGRQRTRWAAKHGRSARSSVGTPAETADAADTNPCVRAARGAIAGKLTDVARRRGLHRSPPSRRRAHCLAADADRHAVGCRPTSTPLTTSRRRASFGRCAARRARSRRRCSHLATSGAGAAPTSSSHINHGDNEYSEVLSPRAADGAVQPRWDLRPPLAAPVRAALRELLRGRSATTVRRRVRSPTPSSGRCRGARVGGRRARRSWCIADVLWDPDPLLFSRPSSRCRTSAPASGPTRFFPATHTEEAHDAHDDDDDDEWLAAQPAHRALLGAGDASLYDARTLHCGDANAADERRALFYVTVPPRGGGGGARARQRGGALDFGAVRRAVAAGAVAVASLLCPVFVFTRPLARPAPHVRFPFPPHIMNRWISPMSMRPSRFAGFFSAPVRSPNAALISFTVIPPLNASASRARAAGSHASPSLRQREPASRPSSPLVGLRLSALGARVRHVLDTRA